MLERLVVRAASGVGEGWWDLARVSLRVLVGFGVVLSGMGVSSSDEDDEERMLGRYSERGMWPPQQNVTSRPAEESRALRSCRSASLPAMAELGPARGIARSGFVEAFGGILSCAGKICSDFL